MRKRQKKKLRSCAMCKPHKMCGACRWSPRELAERKRSDQEILDALRSKA